MAVIALRANTAWRDSHLRTARQAKVVLLTSLMVHPIDVSRCLYDPLTLARYRFPRASVSGRATYFTPVHAGDGGISADGPTMHLTKSRQVVFVRSALSWPRNESAVFPCIFCLKLCHQLCYGGRLIERRLGITNSAADLDEQEATEITKNVISVLFVSSCSNSLTSIERCAAQLDGLFNSGGLTKL